MAEAVDTDEQIVQKREQIITGGIVFQEKSHQDKFKYSILQKLVKRVLSLTHGNADVERSLSANKKTVIPDRASWASLSDV